MLVQRLSDAAHDQELAARCARSHGASALARLRDESDGAILVVGVVMGTLLVGALWNIVSVGDAIVWRERLQDAADAAAFENAVWNARGMNVIAFLNIIMSAAMAILVALRGLIMITTALLTALYAATAACAFAWVPTGITQALCALSLYGPRIIQPANQWAIRTERRVTPHVERFIGRIQTAQEVVATVAPLIGTKESLLKTTAEYEMMAVGVSASLFPSNPRGAVAVAVPSQRESMARIGRGVSLPVSLDGEWKLCEKAGEFVPNELLAWLAQAGIDGEILDMAGGFVRDLAGGIAGSLPAVFCGSRSPAEISQLQDVFRSAARDSCSAADQTGRMVEGSPHTQAQRDEYGRFQDYWERQSPIVVDSNGEATSHRFNRQACERDEIQRQNQSYQPSRGFKSARVWRYTANGDAFMLSWGFSHNNPRHLAGNDRGLTFVEGGNGAHLLDAQVAALGTAQAEMYHDCEGAWDVCGDDAMWRMRWKARLRRLHDPRVVFSRSLANIASAELVNAMHRTILHFARLGEARLGTLAGQNGQGGIWEQISNVLRGNTWDTALLNRGDTFFTQWSPLDWAAQQTVGRWLSQNPPDPSQLTIH
jgi:hypothetical protein